MIDPYSPASSEYMSTLQLNDPSNIIAMALQRPQQQAQQQQRAAQMLTNVIANRFQQQATAPVSPQTSSLSPAYSPSAYSGSSLLNSSDPVDLWAAYQPLSYSGGGTVDAAVNPTDDLSYRRQLDGDYHESGKTPQDLDAEYKAQQKLDEQKRAALMNEMPPQFFQFAEGGKADEPREVEDDLEEKFQRNPIRPIPGRDYDPNPVPIFQGPTGLYFDPRYARSGYRMMASRGGYVPMRRFAGGGSASWSDPYGNQPLAATEYERQFYHLPDPSHIIGYALRNRIQQQELQQQEMNQAMKSATDYLQKQQNEDAANAAMYGMQYPNDPFGGFRNPDIVPDYGGTAALQDARALAQQHYEQSRADAAEALAAQRRGGSGDQGFGFPQTTTDDQGREWRLGAGGHWYPMPAGKPGPNEEPPADFPVGVTTGNAPEVPSLAPQVVTSDDSQAQSQAPSFTSGKQPAQTGIAPSRDEATVGGYYRAPDGSLRQRTS